MRKQLLYYIINSNNHYEYMIMLFSLYFYVGFSTRNDVILLVELHVLMDFLRKFGIP